MFFLADITVAEPSFNYWGQFINMLLTLGFILILIFVSVYLLKRLMRSRIEHLNKSTSIKILERRALNSKTSLYLIDILGQGIVISESPSGIQVVTEFPPDVNVEEKLEKLAETSPPSSFQDSFSKKIRRLATKNA